MTGAGVALVFCLSLHCSLALKLYTNSWAVQIHGGPEETEKIARKFGLVSLGQVISGSKFYHFQHRGAQRKSFSPHRKWNIRLKKEPRAFQPLLNDPRGQVDVLIGTLKHWIKPLLKNPCGQVHHRN